MKKTDCLDIFGEADGKVHNNGVVWTFKKDSLKCGETKVDNCNQEGGAEEFAFFPRCPWTAQHAGSNPASQTKG